MTQILAIEHFEALWEAHWDKGDGLYQAHPQDGNPIPFNFLTLGDGKFPKPFTTIMLRLQTIRLFELIPTIQHHSKLVVIGQPRIGNSFASLGLLALRLTSGKPVVYQCAPAVGEYIPKSFYFDNHGVQQLYPKDNGTGHDDDNSTKHGGKHMDHEKFIHTLSQRKDVWIITDNCDPAGKLKTFKGQLIYVSSGRPTSERSPWILSQLPRLLYWGRWEGKELIALMKAIKNNDTSSVSSNVIMSRTGKVVLHDLYKDFGIDPALFLSASTLEPHNMSNQHTILADQIRSATEKCVYERPNLLDSPDLTVYPTELIEIVPIYDSGYDPLLSFGTEQEKPHAISISTRFKLQPRTKFIGIYILQVLKQTHYEVFQQWFNKISGQRFINQWIFEWSIAFESLAQDLFYGGSKQTWESLDQTDIVKMVTLPEDLIVKSLTERMYMQNAILTSSSEPCYIIPASRHQETFHGVLVSPKLKQVTVVIITQAPDFTITEYAVGLVYQALPDDYHELLNILIIVPQQQDLPKIRIGDDARQHCKINTYIWKVSIPQILTNSRRKYIGDV